MKRLTGMAMGLLLAASLAGSAWAGGSPWHTLGRKLGLGWSDGYHARPVYGSYAATWYDAPVVEPTPAPSLPPVERSVLWPGERPSQHLLPSQRMSQRPVYWYP